MNPVGILQLIVVGLEGIVHALNPKRRRETKKDGIGFALFYVGILAGGGVLVVIVIRDLYFK
jgi:hypothetical protein